MPESFILRKNLLNLNYKIENFKFRLFPCSHWYYTDAYFKILLHILLERANANKIQLELILLRIIFCPLILDGQRYPGLVFFIVFATARR